MSISSSRPYLFRKKDMHEKPYHIILGQRNEYTMLNLVSLSLV